MGIFKWLNETFGETCDDCGEYFPSGALITLNGYWQDGTYCTVCAKEIMKYEDFDE